MKQRILVMNGQRLVQDEQGGEWKTIKVEKAGTFKPGIYNIYLAVPADKAKTSDGIITYLDTEHIYQQTGKNFVKHDRSNFEAIPVIGSNTNIRYEASRAVVSAASIKASRKIS